MSRIKIRSSKKYLFPLAFGAVVIVWVAVLIAPHMTNGLVSLLSAIEEISKNPFQLQWCEGTPRCIGVCLLIYGMAVLWIWSNQKNYRRREEHGSMKWESPESLNRKFSNHKEPLNNRILTQNLRLTTDQRKLRKNLFTLVIGGSGSGKTRRYILPNVLQCCGSMVITDPKGEVLRDTGRMLVEKGYRLVVFDLIQMSTSFRYNPFKYLKDENDLQKLITNIFANTTDKTAAKGEQFWDNTAKMMLSAIMYLVWKECPEEEMNFKTVMDLIMAENVDDEEMEMSSGPSALEMIFEELRERSPEHIAVRYFDMYRKGAGKTVKSFQLSLSSRLEKLNIPSVVNLTVGDELDLERMGEEKTVLFIETPDNDTSFSFLAGMLYTQLFQVLVYQADHKYRDNGGRLPIPVHFMLDEFANIVLPDEFQTLLATMRSRELTASIVLQNIAQLKKIFPNDWQSVSGLCDEILFLGGNEQDSHKWISDFLGKETIDTDTFGFNRGRNGTMSKNMQNQARELLDTSEVRLKDKLIGGKDGAAIVILADEYPTIDRKYDLMSHPNISQTACGGAPIYTYFDTKIFDQLASPVYINETQWTEDDLTLELTIDPQETFRVPVRRTNRKDNKNEN